MIKLLKRARTNKKNEKWPHNGRKILKIKKKEKRNRILMMGCRSMGTEIIKIKKVHKGAKVKLIHLIDVIQNKLNKVKVKEMFHNNHTKVQIKSSNLKISINMDKL